MKQLKVRPFIGNIDVHGVFCGTILACELISVVMRHIKGRGRIVTQFYVHFTKLSVSFILSPDTNKFVSFSIYTCRKRDCFM